MTPEQRLHIRAELARRMGITIEKRWQHATDPTWCLYDVRLPDGTYLGSHCGSIEEAASKLPDPFTDAEDKDALVEWLANQSNETWADFFLELFNQMDKAKHRVGQRDSIRTLTAPREIITLAACKALGIETE